MEDLRSKSCGDGRMQQIESCNGNGIHSMQDLRCYSASYYDAPTERHAPTQVPNTDAKFKRGKSGKGSSSKSWSLNDPELQRKKRVAGYKVYTVEGKVKGSFKKGFRWLKEKYTRVLYGWW